MPNFLGYVPDSLAPVALQVIAVYMSQSALFKTLNLFPPEKNLVSVERAKGSYGVLPYFLSKVLAELPVVAVYPVVFSAVVYPMTGLQPSVCCRILMSSPVSRHVWSEWCRTHCVFHRRASFAWSSSIWVLQRALLCWVVSGLFQHCVHLDTEQ